VRHAKRPHIYVHKRIITLEDVLECLLQEQIYDESDRREREGDRIARWAVAKWKRYVKRRKSGAKQNPDLGDVVMDAMEQAHEGTALLDGRQESKQGGIFGLFS